MLNVKISNWYKNERELKTGVLNSRYTNQPNLLLLTQN